MNPNKKYFQKRVMATVVASAALAGFSSGSVAQQGEPMLEEVVVTGIRGSLQRAMDIKRDSAGVVDAISSEDIGKFPDANLAESLQRVPGVSIDRNAGEGNAVTVRGFGPDFNLVMANGRQMPSSNDGRSFNFNNLASELVSGVEVYKTSSAANPSGGIGSTINVKTARPLDIGEFRMAGTLKGVSDIDEGSVTPEVSGLISNTFADGTIGVLFAASYQSREYEQERVAVDGWRTATEETFENDDAPTALQNPGVSNTGNYFYAQNYNISLQDSERERTNAALVFQYQPNSDLTVTADYLYANLKNEAQSSQLGVWFNGGNVSNVVANENGTVIDMYEEGTFDNIQNWYETVSENNSFGINVDWQVSDNFNLVFDANIAESEENPGGEFNQYQSIIGYQNQQRFQIINGAELPTITDVYNANPDRQQTPFCGNADPEAPQPSWTDQGHANCQAYAAANNIDPYGRVLGTGADGEIAQDLLRAHRNDIQTTNTVDTLDQFRLQGTWEDDNVTLTSGLMYTSQSKNNRLKYNAHEPRNVVEQYAGFWGFPVLNQDVLGGREVLGSGFLDQFSGTENLPRTWVSYNPQDVFDVIWPAMGDGYDQIPREWSPNSYEVEEDTLAAFVELNFDTSFMDMPLNVQTGMRFEKTDIKATGNEQILTGFEYADATSFRAIYEPGGAVSYSEEHDYSILLPNLNLRLNVTDDLVARFGASRTITRPGIGNLQPVRTLGITRPGGELFASAGNPGLRPFSADNIDIGFEWYYNEMSYVSVGYFAKYIDDFIVGGVRSDTINDVTDPSSNGGSFENPTPPSQAEVGEFQITTQVNGETAFVDGLEFAVQHDFSDTGFGVGANYTVVNTDRELDPADVDQRFAITGLSDSANLIGYYEVGPFQARLTYNWRDRFLQGFSQLQGGDAVLVDDYGQWDFSMGYDITDSVTVLLEGINVTGEGYRSTGRYEEQLYEAISTGPRYAIGLRASF